jgi:hypothetical protein
LGSNSRSSRHPTYYGYRKPSLSQVIEPFQSPEIPQQKHIIYKCELEERDRTNKFEDKIPSKITPTFFLSSCTWKILYTFTQTQLAPALSVLPGAITNK